MAMSPIRPVVLLIFALWLAAAPRQSVAAEILAGPYAAAVERVVDGDTIAVRVTIWLAQDISVSVRVRGIDAPELRGRCDGERLRAEEATNALRHLLGDGTIVLTAIEGDKYFGRVVADVTNAAGDDIAAMLVANGFARAYDGGARRSWCEIGARDGGEEELGSLAGLAHIIPD